LNPDYFLGGKMKLDLEKAEQAIKKHVADKLGISVQEAAQGIVDMINVSMANGIREITVKRGYDPREFPLVCAGGAGPLHAAAIAQELGCPLVVVPKESSIFCAAGMLMSDLRHDYVKAHRGLTSEISLERIRGIFADLKEQGKKTLQKDGVPEEAMLFKYSMDMMYAGQYFQVNVPFAPEEVKALSRERIEQKFHQLHDQLYGYSTPGMPVEIVNFNLSAIGVTPKPQAKNSPFAGESAEFARKGTRYVYRGEQGKVVPVPVYDGDAMVHGNSIAGPAIIEQRVTTVVVAESFKVVCAKNDSFILYRRDLGDDAVQRFIEARGVVL
jgi:N-methylhydantoinase A